jgi:hypothetical protein
MVSCLAACPKESSVCEIGHIDNLTDADPSSCTEEARMLHVMGKLDKIAQRRLQSVLANSGMAFAPQRGSNHCSKVGKEPLLELICDCVIPFVNVLQLSNVLATTTSRADL